MVIGLSFGLWSDWLREVVWDCDEISLSPTCYSFDCFFLRLFGRQ